MAKNVQFLFRKKRKAVAEHRLFPSGYLAALSVKFCNNRSFLTSPPPYVIKKKLMYYKTKPNTPSVMGAFYCKTNVLKRHYTVYTHGLSHTFRESLLYRGAVFTDVLTVCTILHKKIIINDLQITAPKMELPS